MTDPVHRVGGDRASAVPPVINVANALTMFRIVLVPVFVVALMIEAGESTVWRIVAFVIFAVAMITDQIDGRIARGWNLVTDFGKMADPIADKALVGAALLALSALDVVPWWVTAVILVREIGVTLLRFWVIRHGVIPASRGGKLKTLLQAIAIGLFVLPAVGPMHVVAWVVMIAALIATVATGVDYVWQAVRLRRSATSSNDAEHHDGDDR